MDITVEHIRKAFGEFPALDDVSLVIPGGKLVALLGPSGSGKTTLLRIIAGIDYADAGTIRFGTVDVTKTTIQARRVGFVFQDYALFDHMTVGDNIAFGLSVRKRPKAEIETRVRELLDRVQLAGLGARFPKQLSGGQRQRVALARALAPEPQLLLLDEPFGALDARVRAELRGWIRRLHDELHLTSIFVTHDQEEALEVADQIVVMNHGRVEQIGEPGEVFDRPASAFVMDFLGGVNVLRGRVDGGRATFGELVLPWSGEGSGAARAFVRGHDLVLRPAGERTFPVTDHVLPVTVDRVRRVGVAARVVVHTADHGELTAELPHHELASLGIERGASLYAQIRSARIFLEPRLEPESP
ncbi:MAG TPA: sulfate ABC transporter ATP-binding protein [Kofleriaceae bacterium]|nr:sulfate ABC transporter ATP-binding protein [Kofleriaceae bacterium]